MPTQRFSESTFAFAATREISKLDPWWSSHSPIFPSLRRERRGGYDVRFDLPATFLLLQYKLSKQADHLRLVKKPRGSAATIQKLRADCEEGLHQFWTTDHQHRLLARVGQRFPYTYYVAPKFAEISDLHALCATNSIMANSMIIKLSEFPPVKRGASCRHRVMCPIGTRRNYIFSKPAVVDQLSLRAELSEIWEEWISEVPLAHQVQEIWDELPRIGKARALKWAQREFALAGERPMPRYVERPSQAQGRYLEALKDSSSERRRPRRPHRPPWPTHLFRPQREAGVVPYKDDELIKLLALSRVFAMAGLSMSVLQPSETALQNTQFYDEGR